MRAVRGCRHVAVMTVSLTCGMLDVVPLRHISHAASQDPALDVRPTTIPEPHLDRCQREPVARASVRARTVCRSVVWR